MVDLVPAVSDPTSSCWWHHARFKCDCLKLFHSLISLARVSCRTTAFFSSKAWFQLMSGCWEPCSSNFSVGTNFHSRQLLSSFTERIVFSSFRSYLAVPSMWPFCQEVILNILHWGALECMAFSLTLTFWCNRLNLLCLTKNDLQVAHQLSSWRLAQANRRHPFTLILKVKLLKSDLKPLQVILLFGFDNFQKCSNIGVLDCFWSWNNFCLRSLHFFHQLFEPIFTSEFNDSCFRSPSRTTDFLQLHFSS